MSNDFLKAADVIDDMKDDIGGNIEREVTDEMGEVEKRVKRQIDKQDIKASGELRALVRQKNPLTFGNLVIQTAVTAPGVYRYVEFGTGPRGATDPYPNSESYPKPSPKPPLAPILNWIVDKGITPIEYDSQYELAVAIQEAIGLVGTAPHPFMRPVWYGPKGKSAVTDSAERGMNDATRRAKRRL